MASFSDYLFYINHGGKLPEDAYLAAVLDAYAEIISQTNGRAISAPGTMQEAVKLCECALADSIAAYKEGAALLPRGVGSISNDGYSISAGMPGGGNPTQAEAQERRAICARYLQWPVNLMSRWL